MSADKTGDEQKTGRRRALLGRNRPEEIEEVEEVEEVEEIEEENSATETIEE